MAMIEAKTPIGKTVMSVFFTVMALAGLVGGLDGNGGAWVVFLAFGGMAVFAWKNTIAHQRYLYEQARKATPKPD